MRKNKIVRDIDGRINGVIQSERNGVIVEWDKPEHGVVRFIPWDEVEWVREFR